MIFLRYAWRTAFERWGWQGPTGVGLLAGSIAIGLAVLAPMEDHVAQVRASLANARKESAAGPRPTSPADPARALAAFYRTFPADDVLTESLAHLHRIGDEHGLALQQADYHAVEDRGRRLGQYRVDIPVVATYPQLKAFLAAALGAMSNLSLDQLSLQKRSVGDATVEAQMQFTLYLRQGT